MDFISRQICPADREIHSTRGDVINGDRPRRNRPR